LGVGLGVVLLVRVFRVLLTVVVVLWRFVWRGVVGISAMRCLRHWALASSLYRSVCCACVPAEQLHGDTYE